MGCCFSCARWEKSKLKKIGLDLPRTNDDKDVSLKLADGTRINIHEVIEAMREDSIHYCVKGIIRPWNTFECFEPRIIAQVDSGNAYGESEGEHKNAYLACWSEEGCPHKQKCYKMSSPCYA